MFVPKEVYRDFLSKQNLIRDNIRLTPKIYKGHTVITDNLLYKLIRYFLDIKMLQFKDPVFVEAITRIYEYSAKYNFELRDIKTDIPIDYAHTNNFLDGVNLSPGQRYPIFDIVLGVISGIPVKDIKGFVELGKGDHNCFLTLKENTTKYWVLYNRENKNISF
jgi:hypothetical protein